MKRLVKILFLILTSILVLGSLKKVEASNFNFNAIVNNSEVKAGEIIIIDLKISDINAGKEGINVVEGILEYDDSIFESIKIEGENDWNAIINAQQGERKGKFLAVKMVEGVTHEEKIGRIELKAKSGIKETTTEIKIKDIKSNNGKDLIVGEKEEKVIDVKVLQVEEPKPEEPKNPNQSTENKKQPVEVVYISDENKDYPENSKRSIIADGVKTGDAIVIIVISAIVILTVNIINFIIKGRKLKERRKNKKSIIIAIIVSVILMGIVILLTKDVIARDNVYIQEMLEKLIKENDDNPESTNYLVIDRTVSRIKPETTIELLQGKLENTTIVTQENGKIEEVKNKTEKVKTGMMAKYKENDKMYKVSVLGDINGDGELNQVEITKEIRECLEIKDWRITDELERISADVTCDGKIDIKDIESMMMYIVFGDLQTEKVEQVKGPQIQIIQGSETETKGWYNSNVKLKITEENEKEKTAKTIYKITGTKEQEYIEVDKEAEIELKEEGVYKVTAYTYGVLGNKSKGTTAIIVINNKMGTPIINVNPVDWTNQSVEVTMKSDKKQYDVEYRINEGDWTKFTEKLQIEENCKIEARLTDGKNHGTVIEKQITNIDKIMPIGKIETLGISTSKVLLQIEGQDATLSGIKEIKVYAKEENEENYECKEIIEYEQDGTEHVKKIEEVVVNNLKSGTTYKMFLEVTDIAGNILRPSIIKDGENGPEDKITDQINEKVEEEIKKETEEQREYSTQNNEEEPTEENKDYLEQVEELTEKPELQGIDKDLLITVTTDTIVKPIILVDKTEWTNQNVEVTIEGEEGFKTEFKINNGEWKEYTDKFKIEENCRVTSRLKEIEGYNYSEEVSRGITNIDKEMPTGAITKDYVKSDEINLNISAQDVSLSGIRKIKIYVNDEEIVRKEYNYEQSEDYALKQEKYKLTELSPNTTYSIYVEIEDNAGNIYSTSENSLEITTLPEATLQIEAKPTKWIKGNVTTIIIAPDRYIEEGYILEYQISKEEITDETENGWIIYDAENKVTVEENTTVYARLTKTLEDTTKIKEKITKKEITNIDKEQPTGTIEKILTSSQSVQFKVTGQDKKLSGIKTIRIFINDELTARKEYNYNIEEDYSLKEEIYELTELTANTNYKVYIEVEDNVGNLYSNKENALEVLTLPEATLDINLEPIEWTGGDVVATITAPERYIEEGYTIEYQLSKGEVTGETENGWISYDTENKVTIQENTIIYARLVRGERKEKIAKKEITNIDKTNPVINIESTSTENSITTIARATDAESGISENTEYIFYIKKATEADSSYVEKQRGTQKNYTFTELEPNTNYTVKVTTTDKVGNEGKAIKEIQTGTLEKPGEGSYTPTEWTNENVIVTLPTREGFTTVYTTDETEPTAISREYTLPFEVSNNCIVRYRYSDGNNLSEEGIQINVENIDKALPSKPILTNSSKGNWTNQNITITASATDEESGIQKFQYRYNDETNWLEFNDSTIENITDGKRLTHTFTEEKNGSLYIHIRAIDNAGNESLPGNTPIKIDKTAPTVSISATNTTNSITATASATDEKSGIANDAQYVFYIKKTSEADSSYIEKQRGTQKNYTFTELELNTNYTVKVTTTDKAGNEGEKTKEIKTKAIYTITYNANGGSEPPSSQTKIEETDLTLSNKKPTREGYTFKGWGTTADATTATYEPGANYSTDEGKTLYAVWWKNVAFVNETTGGDGTKVTVTVSEKNKTIKNYVHARIPANCTIKVKVNASHVGQGAAYVRFKDAYYTDDFMYTTPNNYEDIEFEILAGIGEQAVSATTSMEIESIVDYNTGEYYEPVKEGYIIKYNANGGSGEPSIQVKTKGIGTMLSNREPTREGYTFKGWGTTANATTATYEPGANYSTDEGKTLYAVWWKNVAFVNETTGGDGTKVTVTVSEKNKTIKNYVHARIPANCTIKVKVNASHVGQGAAYVRFKDAYYTDDFMYTTPNNYEDIEFEILAGIGEQAVSATTSMEIESIVDYNTGEYYEPISL